MAMPAARQIRFLERKILCHRNISISSQLKKRKRGSGSSDEKEKQFWNNEKYETGVIDQPFIGKRLPGSDGPKRFPKSSVEIEPEAAKTTSKDVAFHEKQIKRHTGFLKKYRDELNNLLKSEDKYKPK